MAALVANVSAWKQEHTKLTRQAQVLENGLLGLSQGEFSVEQREFQRVRGVNLDLARKKLSAFKTGIHNVKSRLDLLKLGNHTVYSPAEIKKYMEAFEAKLSAYKSTMRAEFDGLTGEEARLHADVQSMATKIDEWELADLALPTSGQPAEQERTQAAVRERTSDRYEKHVALQAKIGAIDRQLAGLGGRYGGWESRDHDAFLRAWVQSVPQPSQPSQGQGAAAVTCAPTATQRRLLIKRLLAAVALKTEEELEAHVEWYVRHSELNAEKHVLVSQWKASRQRERAQHFTAPFAALAEDDEEGSAGGGSADGAGRANRPEDQEAVRLRVATWKQEREAERLRQEQAEKEAALLERQRQDHEQRKRQQQAQLKLDLWKKEAAHLDEQKEKESASTRGRLEREGRVTAAELAARQARDRELTQIQLAKKEAAQDRAKSREIKVRELAQTVQAEVAPTVARDPLRVRTATKAAESHKNEAESRADAELRRATTSAHRSTIAGHGRDLHGTGRSPAAWLSMK
jgi:hypothetical protein